MGQISPLGWSVTITVYFLILSESDVVERLANWLEFATILEQAIDRAPTIDIRRKIEKVRLNLSEYVRGELVWLYDEDKAKLKPLLEWKP